VRIMTHAKVLFATVPVALGLLMAPLAQAESKHSSGGKAATSSKTASGGRSGGKSGGSGNSKMPDLGGLAGLIGNLVRGGGYPR
jgi:hypothetical protein